MAKVWDYEGDTNRPVVLEDPRAGNDGFYINGDKHDKNSLTPQYNKSINFNDNPSDGSWQRDYIDNRIIDSSQRVGASMGLAKMQIGSNRPQDNNTSTNNQRDPGAWIDMTLTCTSNGVGEGGYKGGSMQVISDGVDESAVWTYMNSTTCYQFAWPKMDNTTNLDDVRPTARHSNWSDNYSHRYHFFGKPYGADKYVPALSRGDDGTSFYSYPSFKLKVGYHSTAGSQWPNNWPSQYTRDVYQMGNYWTVQFLGESNDGGLLFAGQNCASGTAGNYIKVAKEVWTNNYNPTSTNMFNYTNAIPAGGTHQGGHNLNSKHMASNFSEVMDDPRGVSGTNMLFYKSYYDSYYNWHPLVVTWDRSSDTFAVETDISTDVMSSTHADLSGFTAYTGNQHTMQWSTTSWVSGGTRYVSEFRIDGRYTFHDTDEGWRTWVTYSVNAADPKNLTYHSKVTMPSTPRQWVWLNDSHTMIGVWFTSAFRVYAWNDSTGWTETSVVDGYIHECGRDSLDRIWYTKPSSVYGGDYPELHLLTPTLPVSITVTPENTSYTYSGSDITTYIDVSAVNASGTRIATSVKLVIEGSSMTFTDGTTTKTVTTLTTGELQVGTIVTGAGFTNVAASIEI